MRLTNNITAPVSAFGLALGGGTTATSSSYSYQRETKAADQAVPKPVTVGEPTVITEQLLDARLEAVEARTDSKFAQLLGKMDVLGERMVGISDKVGALSDKVGHLESQIGVVDGHVSSAKGVIISIVIGTGIAVAALAFTAVQVFQGGMSATSSAFDAGMSVGSAQKEAAASPPAKAPPPAQ